MAEGLVLLPPMRWKFMHPDDVAEYGDGWWIWDERAVSRLKARELIALEDTVGMVIPAVIQGIREDRTAACMAAMWISMHRAGHPVEFGEFDPAVMLTDWEVAPEAPLESGAAPTPDSDSSEPPTTESATS